MPRRRAGTHRDRRGPSRPRIPASSARVNEQPGLGQQHVLAPDEREVLEPVLGHDREGAAGEHAAPRRDVTADHAQPGQVHRDERHAEGTRGSRDARPRARARVAPHSALSSGSRPRECGDAREPDHGDDGAWIVGERPELRHGGVLGPLLAYPAHASSSHVRAESEIAPVEVRPADRGADLGRGPARHQASRPVRLMASRNTTFRRGTESPRTSM